MARAAAVLPAPRSPERDDVAGPTSSARSAIRCAVAASFASAAVNVVGAVIRRRCVRVLVDRKVAGDRGAFADHRIDAHLAAVQFDEGAHQRQAEAGAAMTRAVGVALEPVEHLVLDVSRAGA